MSVYVYHPSGISSLFIIMLHKLQINKMFHRSISKLFVTVVRESSTVCCPYVTRELWKCLDMSYWMIKVSVIPFVSLLSASRMTCFSWCTVCCCARCLWIARVTSGDLHIASVQLHLTYVWILLNYEWWQIVFETFLSIQFGLSENTL
jgi:hypothetical protein